MQTVFQLNESEFNSQIVEAIKSMFKNRNIIVSIQSETDENDYLLSTSANAKRLLASVSNANSNQNLTEISILELKKMANA
jgi:hypothetical protein